MKIFLYELKKITVKQYALFIFLLVILVRLFSLPDTLKQDYGFYSDLEKDRYLEMIEAVSGKLTEENEAIIIGYKEDLLAAQAEEKRLRSEYDSKKITFEEFLEQLEPYNEILDNENIIDKIFEQYNYVITDRENRAILPVSNVPIIESSSVDFLFLLCVVFCCAFAVMNEYTSKTNIILKTTPKGQSNTMAVKITILLSLIALTSIALSLIDLISLSAQLAPQYWGYGIRSVEQYNNSHVEISIGAMFAVVQLLKMLGFLLLGVSAMITARLTKNYVASVFPFIAFPIVVDYLAERDSQGYFLPTGLLKGYGYFFGDVADVFSVGDPVVYFHAVPVWVMTALIIFAMLFIILGAFALIRADRNRLAK